MTTTATTTTTGLKPATPTKLHSGAWGARVAAPVSEGEYVEIRTRAGKTWAARVNRVVWTDGKIAIVATQSTDRPRSTHPRPARNGECRCGGCADLLSLGYRPGARVRCESCGGWAEAC